MVSYSYSAASAGASVHSSELGLTGQVRGQCRISWEWLGWAGALDLPFLLKTAPAGRIALGRALGQQWVRSGCLHFCSFLLKLKIMIDWGSYWIHLGNFVRGCVYPVFPAQTIMFRINFVYCLGYSSFLDECKGSNFWEVKATHLNTFICCFQFCLLTTDKVCKRALLQTVQKIELPIAVSQSCFLLWFEGSFAEFYVNVFFLILGENKLKWISAIFF